MPARKVPEACRRIGSRTSLAAVVPVAVTGAAVPGPEAASTPATTLAASVIRSPAPSLTMRTGARVPGASAVRASMRSGATTTSKLAERTRSSAVRSSIAICT